MTRKISFKSLSSKFKFSVIRHFLLTAIWTILLSFSLANISNIMENNPVQSVFFSLLPSQLRKRISFLSEPGFFALWWLLLTSTYALVYWFDSLQEEKLRIKGEHYLKNLLLDKFRHLSWEEKQTQQKEIGTLVELDAGEIGHYWDHIPNHVFHSILTIILLLWVRWDDFWKMDNKSALFSVFWLLMINLVNFLFTRSVLRNEKKYKKELTQEWAKREKETSQTILIESMGLSSHYRSEQQKISRKNRNLLLSFASTKSSNKTIPHHWLAEMLPYLLLLISGSWDATRKNLLALWFIFENFGEIFQCFWDYSDYASSLSRINNFLVLTEKKDNLAGVKIAPNSPISVIHFQNVSFHYQKQEKQTPVWTLKNYNRSFSPAKINYLLGANGTGKSTIFYLLLGMLTPQKGQIVIEDQDGKTYQLHTDLNLNWWRENNVAYCAHNNLITAGSTGEKQLVNINRILTTKKDAQIFLFDEADNALDKANQQEIHQKIKQLTKQGKIVIYIKHDPK